MDYDGYNVIPPTPSIVKQLLPAYFILTVVSTRDTRIVTRTLFEHRRGRGSTYNECPRHILHRKTKLSNKQRYKDYTDVEIDREDNFTETN